MKYTRVRITWPNGETLEGLHTATIPEETTANRADIELFYGIKLGEVGWLAERYRIEPHARYLIQLDAGGSMVVAIEPGVQVDKLEA